MHYLIRPVRHLHPICAWVEEHGATSNLNPASMLFTITHEDRTIELIPKFVEENDGVISYNGVMTPMGDFVGWLPYPVKQWKLSSDKLAFKDNALTNGLRVTVCWIDSEPLVDDFIIKPTLGSFGYGIRGPYGPNSPAPQHIPLRPGEFCEQYIRGRSAKAWYWNDQAVALELLPPPHLRGDGRRSLAEIASQPRGNIDAAIDLDWSAQMLAWQGYTQQTILPEGEIALLDFKYATPFDRISVKNRNVWGKVSAEIEAQFAYAGPILYRGIDETIRENSVFTVDAVVDDLDQVWFLEMNSNPMTHPNVYRPMLDSIFGV